MPKLLVMDHTGHSEEAFDPNDIVSLHEAERRFAELTARGFTAAKITGDGKNPIIRQFDPTAEQILMIPRLRGGDCLVPDDLVLLGVCVSVLASCIFVLIARLRVHGIHSDALAGATVAANERAIALLKTCLTPEQREHYEKHRFFDVIGSDTGRLYRIKYGTQSNIIEIDKRRRRICGWCFLPEGGLAAGDVMLAQKIALENKELETLAIANRS